MAQMLDVEDLSTVNVFFNQGLKSTETLSLLASTEWCGLFIMIDKILKNKKINQATARLALDLLRNIYRSHIVIEPSANDNVHAFVEKLLVEAKKIADSGIDAKSTLAVSAKHLKEVEQTFEGKHESSVKLTAAWHTFLLHYYREHLYKYL